MAWNQEGQTSIKRKILQWLNQSPVLPEGIDAVRYETLGQDTLGQDTACMALSLVQEAYAVRRYIVGGYRAEYQFRLIYRIKPEGDMEKRLQADEALDRVGAWASSQKPDLGEPLHVLKVEQTARASLFAAHENGDEEHQILMKIIYEVM